LTARKTSPQEQVEEKVGNWKHAFDNIAAEIEVPGMMAILQQMQADEGMRNLPLYTQLARIVAANRRAAATVAALLVATGIKPTAIDYGDDA
jgi:hypothetical protein